MIKTIIKCSRVSEKKMYYILVILKKSTYKSKQFLFLLKYLHFLYVFYNVYPI